MSYEALSDRASRLERSIPAAEDLFDVVFSGHFIATVRLAALLGADDPENLAQEAFARLHTRIDRFRDTQDAVRYARRIVANLSRSRLRHLGVARRAMPRLLETDHPTTPEEVLDSGESARVVMHHLNQLSPRQRQVLVLRYWGDLSEAEIASTLQISVGSVKTHASRGMSVLERALGADL